LPLPSPRLLGPLLSHILNTPLVTVVNTVYLAVTAIIKVFADLKSTKIIAESKCMVMKCRIGKQREKAIELKSKNINNIDALCHIIF